ncbi:MAG TPA: hypothetical protein VGQ78_08330 [Vicinamibacteria bacterium]|nr:hypothetical protein [Vicinamibacteria bacterium]
MTAVPRRLALGIATVALFAAARGPLLRATLALPLTNDDALALLMARHLLGGELATTFWNAPYNGALDSYLLAPGLLVLAPHALFRLYQLACAALVVALSGLLARELAGETAGWIAAALAAVGSPYMALAGATASTPTIVLPVLVSLPALAAMRTLGGRPPSLPVTVVIGLLSGLAVWDSALALPSLVGIAAGTLAAGARLPRKAAAFVAAFAIGVLPMAVAFAVHAAVPTPVTGLRPRWLWPAAPMDLARATAGLVGLSVPVLADGPIRLAMAPGLRVLLGAALALATILGAAARRALPLAGWIAFAMAGFVASGRARGDRVRYLLVACVPVMSLAAAGLLRLSRRSPVAGAAAALAIAGPWLYGERALVRRWREPGFAGRAWGVPPLGATIAAMRAAGVRSAYASLQFAGRLTLESDEAVIATQAWNERFPGDPLRFRDEVDLDPAAAWALAPEISRGMPRADGFRAVLKDMRGSWKEAATGPLVLFYGFTAPYDESLPVPPSALNAGELGSAVLDRDVGTAWTSPQPIRPGFELSLRTNPPRRLDAVVLALDVDRSPLAVPWECTVDGNLVARGPYRHGLQWVNGAPRAGKQALMVLPIGGRMAAEVELTFRGEGPPLVVREVFAYGPDEAPRPPAAAAVAAAALERFRVGDWAEAARLYGEAVRLEPERASHHSALMRARWRAARRGFDVESLDDGGSELVGVRGSDAPGG